MALNEEDQSSSYEVHYSSSYGRGASHISIIPPLVLPLAHSGPSRCILLLTPSHNTCPDACANISPTPPNPISSSWLVCRDIGEIGELCIGSGAKFTRILVKVLLVQMQSVVLSRLVRDVTEDTGERLITVLVLPHHHHHATLVSSSSVDFQAHKVQHSKLCILHCAR